MTSFTYVYSDIVTSKHISIINLGGMLGGEGWIMKPVKSICLQVCRIFSILLTITKIIFSFFFFFFLMGSVAFSKCYLYT